jgi:hypothetical protein
MRLIAIIVSAVTLVYLVYSFVIEHQEQQRTEQAIKSPVLVIPAYISDTPLLVEQVWQDLKDERRKAKAPIEKEFTDPLNNKDILTIGDNKYALYGIFNGQNDANSKNRTEPGIQAFILIKTIDKNDKSTKALMQKVILGEKLSKGITLAAVTSNSISFKQDDKLIEFKLFEAQR